MTLTLPPQRLQSEKAILKARLRVSAHVSDLWLAASILDCCSRRFADAAGADIYRRGRPVTIAHACYAAVLSRNTSTQRESGDFTYLAPAEVVLPAGAKRQTTS